jgi:hypothetical protein
MIFSDLNDLGDGSRQPFSIALKFAKFAVNFNHRSNLPALRRKRNYTFLVLESAHFPTIF